ncbi:MFS transporter [Campylobacter sp. MIT 99-7217]|uniref:NTP/NDP exchange transporter n=1 Tax=Campylobacter sp. MIT 99-7217 TaxID=535091 RepID=UPI001159CE74|nr:MFS transporter [Campylobacter sp. MIT 99-7217]TQR31936.1 MFS transporter [Campylobacter sp. MIT 99-7217]
MFLQTINKIFSLKQGEIRLLLLSVLFIFMLFSSYAILRPLRDALGLEGGQDELKWLFLGTFIATILGSLLAMRLSGAVKRKFYLNAIFIFFASNLLCFYVALFFISTNSQGFVWLARIFYVWVSVFNLFIISSAWSLLADIFNKDQSKRLFGIITAGASLGSILGAFSVKLLSSHLDAQNFILISVLLLFLVLILKAFLLKESLKLLEEKQKFIQRFNTPIGSKSAFIGFSIIIKSKFLLVFVGFILLLTSVSTFLYMEQARIISELFPKSDPNSRALRTAAFANIDFIVQSLSFIIQIFFTAKIANLSLKWLLCPLGFILSFAFVILAFTHPALLPIIIAMSVRRVGEYALVKPAREMLFVPLSSEEKYKVKNFLDTVVYRGGDALSAQLEASLLHFGVAFTLISGGVLSFLWGILGLKLSKDYEKNF